METIEDHIAIGRDEEGLDSDLFMDISRLKERATKKKGRGFTTDETGVKAGKDIYDAMDTDEIGPGPQRSVEGWILFVTNIHEEASEAIIHDHFMEAGIVKNLHLNLDRRTGFIKGYALVEYETINEAKNAKERFDGTDILGQVISVSWAFVKAPKGSHQRRRSPMSRSPERRRY